MRRRDAWWDGRRCGVVDNFHIKLTCIARLDVPASFCIGCAVEKKSKKPTETSSLTKITSDA